MNKKGFTLVELLAVIVILAVLALIATPVVLSIIDDAKESAMLRSAEMYLSGVENAVMRENMNSGGNFRPNECTITNGNMTCSGTEVEVEVDGEVPSTGSITFENGKITEVTLNYESGTIVKDSSGKLVYNQDNKGNSTLATQYIINLYNDGSKINTVNIGGDTTKPQVHLNSTQGIMLDNNGEYRYYGANPNNYISFNGELWRIINVANVKSNKEDTIGSQRLRIIKGEPIGYHSWDADTDNTNSNNNNWETSTLNATLNGIYYNGTSGTCYMKDSVNENGFHDGTKTTCDYSENGTIKGLNDESRNLIDNAVWYLGSNETVSGLYANDFYTFERGTTVYGDNPTSTVAKLGIMYPSDYAYATDLSKCAKAAGNTWDSVTQTGLSYGYDKTNCAETDWLYDSDYQWLISSDSSYSNSVYMVEGASIATTFWAVYGCTTSTFLVQPVAVLKSNVAITGGTGTSGEPYKLSLSE